MPFVKSARVILTIAMLLLPSILSANGFDIYEQSAKAVGLGGAVVAQADDPSAIFFNPAGIVQLGGTQVSVGACPIIPTMQFRSNGNPAMGTASGQTWNTRDNTWVIPNAYMTHQVNNNISVGLGMFSHFGLGVEWPYDFEGRYSPGASKTVLKTSSISPVIAVKPAERWSIGFGPYMQYFNISLRNQAFVGLPTPPLTAGNNIAQTAEVELKGTNWAWGYNAGLRLKLTETLAFGASYISETRQHITDGTQTVTSSATGQRILRQDFSATMVLPAKLRMGLAWKRDAWTIEGAAEWTEWSSYSVLRADFADGTFLESQKKWRNVWMYRIGVQYALNKFVDLRAAFLYDESPIPADMVDPLVPSGDRPVACLGVGLHFGDTTIDVGYNHVWDKKRTWNNASGDVKAGPYPVTRVTGQFRDASADLFAVNLTYKF
jgi:long-chain fatty acid transport protein